MPTAYNPLDRPRTVVVGCDDAHPVTRVVRELTGSCSLDPLANQPLQDRDLVVGWQPAGNCTTRR